MPEVVEALMAVGNIMEVNEFYIAHLIEHVRPNPVRHIGERDTLRREFNRLCTLPAYSVLALVWKESGFIREQDLERAGLERLRDDGKLNRHALGGALMNPAYGPDPEEKAEKHARRAQRIVEAGITFGLIEPQEQGTKSLKPLRATERLHTLMMEVGGIASALFDCGD